MRVVAILAIVVFVAGAGPASRPTSGPVGERQSLANDLIRFVAPPNPPWTTGERKGDAESVVFVNTSRDGAIQIALLPKSANVDREVAEQVAVAIRKEIRSE